MQPRARTALPFDATLDPALAALLAACDGTRAVPALTAVVQAVEPAADETAVWAMLDDLAALGCLEQAAAPPAERGFSRRSWLRGVALSAAAATAVVAAKPARAQAAGDLPGDEALAAADVTAEDGTVCSYRQLTAGGLREEQQKGARSVAAEETEKASLRYEEERAKADVSSDRVRAEEARKRFQAARSEIREEEQKSVAYRPPARRMEQDAKARQQRLGQERTWQSEPGVGRAPAFLDLGAKGVLEGEVDVLRTTFFEKDGACGGLSALFHFRSRRGEPGVDPESLAARPFAELLDVVKSGALRGGDGAPPEVTIAWGISEGLAWTGPVSAAKFTYTGWDEAGEPSEGAVRLDIV